MKNVDKQHFIVSYSSSPLYQREKSTLATFNLSSANAFNLFRSKILSRGKEVTFENNTRKGEKADNQHFLLFPKFFPFYQRPIISLFEPYLNCYLKKKMNLSKSIFCLVIESYTFSGLTVKMNKSSFLAHLSTTCSRKVLRVVRCLSSVVCHESSTISLHIFTSQITGPIWTKLGRNVPWEVLF